ncbi:MAG: FliM/FliN family flagellar motor switch protein [Candidatus Eremiobacteraeota bacterium]|nr:FliM/FliN family flagellar motor switch protein [Candidatus Eremiobacteraeota bacterium]
MIADLAFAGVGAVRPARFVARPSIPLEAACVVANAIRQTLRELLARPCDLVLGEPAALDAHRWSALVRDAHAFLTRGRQTDVVLVVPRADARRLVLQAFGEGDDLPDAACSTLELHALERIAARCAGTFEVLCAERRGAPQAVSGTAIPQCVAYFDLRVRAPLGISLGVGIVRDLPDPGPGPTLPRAVLDDVAIELRAVFAEGTIEGRDLLALQPGDVVPLDTALDGPAMLNAGDACIARGSAGIAGGNRAFLVERALGAGGRRG